jgi:3'-phosphoadenosine 5'-phosphosulfate sulfotransferase (PAPS reductase)/FAD synthetase
MESKMLAWAGAPEEEKITKLLSPPVEEKEKISRDIVKDSIANAENPVVCFSGGKKSTVLLHLIKNLSFKKF